MCLGFLQPHCVGLTGWLCLVGFSGYVVEVEVGCKFIEESGYSGWQAGWKYIWCPRTLYTSLEKVCI